MQLDEALRALENAGTAQNRKVYARHGVRSPQFGVSWAFLRKFAKQIKTDHELAEQLWATGNYDARILATLIADPTRFTLREIDRWARDLDCYALTSALTVCLARSRFAQAKAEKWSHSPNEWLAASAWQLVSLLALEANPLPDGYFEDALRTIESEIHTRKNYVRYTMNSAVIAIGLRNARLKRQALAAAKNIGKVHVDHGATSCKTPDAAEYIERSLARKC